MKLKELFQNEDTIVDAVLLTSRENKYYTAGLYSGSGYVFLCQDETYVIVDGRYYTDMKQKNQSDVVLLMEESKPYWKIINQLAAEKKIDSIGIENTMDLVTYRSIEKNLNVSLIDMDLTSLRAVKQTREIEEIKSACEIAVKAYDYIQSFIKIGMTEKEVANELVYYMKKLGAEKESFDTIVLSGVRCALPHGKPSDKKIENGDFIVMDYGAVYHNYCSDITRTFQIGKQCNEKLTEIYRVVLEAQKAAIAAIKPGKGCAEIDTIARNYITEKGYGDYFIHNLGHSMGILCHEEPRFSPKEKTVCKPGMVLTVEPGIYIEGLGGVRIEDDILVTEYGCEVLTKGAKKEYSCVEG